MNILKYLREKSNETPKSIENFISEVAKGKTQRFTRKQLMSFTSNFKTQIGSGGYADVYRGLFPDSGVKIAVKVLKNGVGDVIEMQFMAEVSTMAKTSHRNLVKLYGFCFDAKIKALVYEYMENGSLDMILYENHLRLEWVKLYNIATATAKALSYLHEYCEDIIIHYDIKAANVLLDSNFDPKVADFGLAKLCNKDLSHFTHSGFRGTRGYAAPEVWMGIEKISCKCDIFSFGMMLFEVLGRKRLNQGELWFPGHVWKNFEKGQLDEIIFGCGIGENDKEKAKTLSIVALWCIQYNPRDRPLMSTVVKVLEGEIQLMSPPNPFPYYDFSSASSMSSGSSSKTTREPCDGGSGGGLSSSASSMSSGSSSKTTCGPCDGGSGGGISSELSIVETLPLFTDVAVSDRETLFIRKIRLCCIMFDFSDTLKLAQDKETKRQTLTELVSFVSGEVKKSSGKINEICQEELMRMISINIFHFRCVPLVSHENTGVKGMDPKKDDPYPLVSCENTGVKGMDPEQDDSYLENEDRYLDPSWQHLQIVYELLIRYVVSPNTDTKIAKRYIDHSFLLKILNLFDTDDPRERKYLKTILHRIYGKFMVHRPFLRKEINNIFYQFIYETKRHSGIRELLETLGSIINGFALPVKLEHTLFLVRVLIPLHKPKSLGMYHKELTYCILQFIEKDYKLAVTVIGGLLRHWPRTNCQQELLFLVELEEILEATRPVEFQRCIVPLFKQIGRCLSSYHFQVATRALFFWNNEHIVKLIEQNRRVVLPIIFEALEKNIQTHWNQAVNGLTVNVRKMFLEMEYIELFEMCQRQYQEKIAHAKDFEEQREFACKKIEAVAAARPVSDGW